MSERVGGIHYDVELNTRKLIDGQREIEKSVGRAASSMSGLGTVLTSVTRAIGLYAAALSVAKAASMADDMRLLSARVQVAAGSVESGAQAMAELNAISQRTQTSITANASAFGRLNQIMLQMGGTQADTLRLTELLSKAIKVSGGTTQETTSAMLQFGQALGAGKLSGDEFRSLMENAPYLMRQLADGLQVPIGALKSMSEQGELTSDRVISALGKAADQINKDFSTFPQTVGAAFQAMQDAAARANAQFDELTGTSAALAGGSKGLGDVLDQLAQQFGAANDEAGKLGRNGAIKGWADSTRVVLSYVVDAVDVTWQALSVFGRNVAFVFQGLGAEMGGIAAQVEAVARGDFAQAKAIGDMMEADSAARRARLDAADAKTLARTKTAGQQMRDAWESGAGGGRGFVNPSSANAGGGKLTPAAGGKQQPGKKGSVGASFDATGYLASLTAQTAEAWDRIGIIESEALRRNDELLAKRDISAAQHAQAIKLIEANAAQERQQLEFDAATERLKIIEQAGEQEAAARLRAKALIDALIADGMSPADRLRLEEAEKLGALEEALAADYSLRERYELAKQALRSGTQAKLDEIEAREKADQEAAQSKQLQGYGQMFDGMAGMVEAFSGKQNAAYKVLFSASKAFAVAESIIKIQQGIANAASLPFPGNLGAMATVAASTAGIISTIKGTSYGGGRQYGGPVTAGSLYRVNETGRPEMFTAANGSQYMMPTASGRVTAADRLGGGVSVRPQVHVHNYSGGAVRTQQSDDGSRVDVFIGEVVRQIRDNSGPVWSAMRGATNVQGKL